MRSTRLAIVFCTLMAPTLCHAQQAPCGLTSMTEPTEPVYPPIAKAAHAEGNVIMLVSFKTNGEVEKIDVISGPEMLRAAATTYVKSWHANEYTGPRTCPIVILFVLNPRNRTVNPTVRNDLQHVTVNAPAALIQASNL